MVRVDVQTIGNLFIYFKKKCNVNDVLFAILPSKFAVCCVKRFRWQSHDEFYPISERHFSQRQQLFFVQMSMIFYKTFQLHSADEPKLVILLSPTSRVEPENNVMNRRPCVCKYSAYTTVNDMQYM